MQSPIVKFDQWITEAKATPAIADATAMTLATATPDGKPAARTVLLKDYGEQGFSFYTNFTSRKGSELKNNPRASLCFYWMPLGRQVIIEGRVTPVSEADADAYFASRPRPRQIAAWASHQSQPLASRAELDARVADMETKFDGGAVPRPPHWSGWQLHPESIEFLELSQVRLHVREQYRAIHGGWEMTLINP